MFGKIVNYYQYLWTKGKISDDMFFMIEECSRQNKDFKSFLIEISKILN
jgi:hypothetical protein